MLNGTLKLEMNCTKTIAQLHIVINRYQNKGHSYCNVNMFKDAISMYVL